MKIKTGLMKKLQHLVLLCLPPLLMTSVLADETEIFYQNEASKVNTNVLFLLDASGSMTAELSGSGGKSRMEVMKETFREVMDTAPKNLNIGLMHYANSSYQPSYNWSSIKGVNFPISPLDENANAIIGAYSTTDNLPDPAATGMPVRAYLADIVDSWQAAGYTPIVDSLLEASRYFRGEGLVWGKTLPANSWAAHPSTYEGALSCSASHNAECGLTWGECNGTVDMNSCQTRTVSQCCEWVETAAGSYCKNNNYSCRTDLQFCQHTLCDTYSGTLTYRSPIKEACQANYLVLMSDGKPEYPYYSGYTADGTGRYPESVEPDAVYPNTIPPLSPNITGASIATTVPALISAGCADTPQGYKSGKCGPELTRFLADNDQSSTLAGDQTIKTFTVALGLADEPTGTAYLAQLATAENGAYTADNRQQLVTAFSEVLGNIQKDSFSFSSPSFTVDESNMLAHDDKVFVPVFDSNNTPLWSGNLRKFEVDADGKIVDANGSSVLDTDGSFVTGAKDLWSSTPHGSDVTIGGAASRLPAPDARTLWTDAGSNTLVPINVASTAITPEMFSSGSYQTAHNLLDIVGVGGIGADGVSCWGNYTDCDGVKHNVFGNLFTGSGCVNIEAVTTCPLTAVTSTYRTTLINYLRGYKDGIVSSGSGAARQHMGDMLNTKPVVINYGNNNSRVFVATNEGYLHSLDVSTGIEQWAFMPADLLQNADTLFRNEDLNKHVYGLDGALSVWRIDHNNNGIIETAAASEDLNGDGDIDSADQDHVYLFFGLRRGGRMYYALDLTVPSNPKVLWKISPDGANGALDDGFAALGETWSKPALSKMRVSAPTTENPNATAFKYVLVFGGGYDPNKDEQDISKRVADASGHDVYMVDALSGQLIWSLKNGYHLGGSSAAIAGSSALTHSVAGDIRVLDMDGNGALDRLYFADTGGNVWRVDMDMDITDGDEGYYNYGDARLTKLASLGGGSGSLDHRKFFYEPDTALRLNGGKPVLSIALGSGYRTHPLNTEAVADRFYVLRDEYVYQHRPADAAVITDSGLWNAADTDASSQDLSSTAGWYYAFSHNGEKVLAPALTFLDKVLFTTFAQADEAGELSEVAACQPAVNSSRAYVLDVLRGRPVLNLDRDAADGLDPYVVTGVNEIMDAPQLVFGALNSADGGECVLGDCQQTVQVRVGKMEVPLLDLDNTKNQNTSSYQEMSDITRLLPRLYWLDGEVANDHE